MKTIGHTSSGKPVYAAFQLHRGFSDWTANDHADAADLHREAARTDIKTNASMHKNSAVLHDDEARKIQALVQKLGLAGKTPRHHARRKSPTQLDREIAEALDGRRAEQTPRSRRHATTAQSGKRIDRRKLGGMMFPWGSDFAYGQGSGAVGAVASYYYDDKKYPDRGWVARALEQIEADIPRAEHGAHGWTRSDAKDLRRIAQGLRYYLAHDYGS